MSLKTTTRTLVIAQFDRNIKFRVCPNPNSKMAIKWGKLRVIGKSSKKKKSQRYQDWPKSLLNGRDIVYQSWWCTIHVPCLLRLWQDFPQWRTRDLGFRQWRVARDGACRYWPTERCCSTKAKTYSETPRGICWVGPLSRFSLGTRLLKFAS